MLRLIQQTQQHAGAASCAGAPLVSRRSIYRRAEKLYLKSRLFRHTITDHEAHIINGVYAAPAWWEAVNDYPMFSLYRTRVNWKPMETSDTPLIREVLRFHPEMADAPHALAPGLERYYVHPVRKFVERWKVLMDQGVAKDDAFSRVHLEQWREKFADKIENDVQVHQAGMFGAPAPDVASQLIAIDRDMRQAVHAGVVHLKLTRFERLRQIAEKKIKLIYEANKAKYKAAGEFGSRLTYYLDGQAPREVIEDIVDMAKDCPLPSFDGEDFDDQPSISVSAGPEGEIQRRERAVKLREKQMRNFANSDDSESEQEGAEFVSDADEADADTLGDGNDYGDDDEARANDDDNDDNEQSFRNGAPAEDDELPSGPPPDFTNDFPYMLNDHNKLTYNDVRLIMTDAQFLEFKGHFPQLKEAFEPMLWEADTFFAERMHRLQQIEDEEMAHPLAARLKVKQDSHLVDLAKLGPYLGRDPQGRPLHPEASPDVRNVDELMDMLTLLKSPPELMRDQRPPEPEDLVDYDATNTQDLAPKTAELAAPARPYVDGMYENFYDEKFDDARTHAKPDVFKEHDPEQIQAEVDAAKQKLLAQLSALREHLTRSSKFAILDPDQPNNK